MKLKFTISNKHDLDDKHYHDKMGLIKFAPQIKLGGVGLVIGHVVEVNDSWDGDSIDVIIVLNDQLMFREYQGGGRYG